MDRMKKRSFVLTLLCALIFTSSKVWASSDPTLIGEWRLVSMIYQGKDLPLPNPELNLRWTFFPNGSERLYWDRGTVDFCERFGHYQVLDGILVETSFALNPKNALDCAQDPDMQIGKVTRTRIQIRTQELWLYFGLGDEELIYVLRQDRLPIFR
ncbi:MAG: lipocalin family protein [Pseudobdellovibrionaceae bacterium]